MTSNSGTYTPLPIHGEDPETGVKAVYIGSSEPNHALRFEDELQIHNAGQQQHQQNQQQQNLYFFGCCCDFRRAVLALNTMWIVLRLSLMIGILVMASVAANNLDEFEDAIEDDQVKAQVETAVESGLLPVLEAVFEFFVSIGIVFGAIGIYGALKFKRWAIVTPLWFYGFCLFVSILSLDLLDASLYGICVYAHVRMLSLMKEGIMTDENYHKIASCCGGGGGN